MIIWAEIQTKILDRTPGRIMKTVSRFELAIYWAKCKNIHVVKSVSRIHDATRRDESMIR